MPKYLYIESPKNFSFQETLFSHGWSQLLPFEVNRESLSLRYVFDVSEKSIAAQVSETNGKLAIEIADDELNQAAQDKILRDVRHILRLDDDLRKFYQTTKTEKRLAWIHKMKAGRLLRSPTVWEDLVKTLCTTNCSWALTKNMTANLVNKLGAPDGEGKRAFPTAQQMAAVSEDFYKNEIRAGYRSAYFVELAKKAASGKINPESWLNSDLPTKELKQEMKSVKGVGNYAAENLLKLVGRYDGLALDSMLRGRFYEKHNGGEICGDAEIENFYKTFGDWRGLTIWCDLS